MTLKIKKSVIMGGFLIIIVIIGGWFLFKLNNETQREDNQKNIEVEFRQENNRGAVSNKVVEIEMVARQFSFEPNPIRVKYGERVRLKIKSEDVVHGFALPDFNINVVLNPGEISTVEFVADKRGKFEFYCSIACGVGHLGMRGSIIIE